MFSYRIVCHRLQHFHILLTPQTMLQETHTSNCDIWAVCEQRLEYTAIDPHDK